jgi:predicted ATPase/DNA-binding SARP family transcriptional activator
MQLSIKLLGAFHATVDGEPIAESRTKKIEALLAYLAMESDVVHRRETLVGLLFPEQPEETARTNLRQTLTRLRRAIFDKDADPPFLLISRESTQFNLDSHVSLDVIQFHQLTNGCDEHKGSQNGRCADCMARLAEGLTLYKGPFLDGFFLQDSTTFDEWANTHRAYFKQVAQTSLHKLATYHEQRGEYLQAETAVRQLIGIEPWDEAAQQQLMRLLAYQGQRNAALYQYQTFFTLLEEELGVEPIAETQTLRTQIANISDQRPRQLPARELSFIGREEELAQISLHLASPKQRLVTLVGSGGIGKTRLAIEAGWRVADKFLGPFMHGVFFVSLAGVAVDGEPTMQEQQHQLLVAIAEGIGFSYSGSQNPLKQLTHYLQKRSLLLILDNCEHIVPAARELLQLLLRDTMALNVLATSRERFNLASEWTLDIVGLAYPQRYEPHLNLTQYSAIQLFVERAQQVDSQFTVGEDGRSHCPPAAVTHICQLLYGIPLAIELATAWVRMLTCSEIAREIEQNLDALTTTMAHIPARHRSMRAVFDHSWHLLSEAEQQTAARLSVFRGGFSRHAAQTITTAHLSQLASLLDKSLLHRTTEETIRFQMQEVLRQYATQKLSEMPDAETAVRQHHTTFYLSLLADHTTMLRSSQQEQAVDEISLEIRNIRAAWQSAIDENQFNLINTAIDALGLFYYMRSWFVEGADLFTRAVTQLSSDMLPLTIYGKLLARQGWFTFLLGKHTAAHALLHQSLQLLRSQNATEDMIFNLNFLAVVTYTLGDYTAAETLCLEGLALCHTHQDQYNTAIANNILSQITFLMGDFERSRQYCETSLMIEETIGNRWSMGFSFINLGRVAFAQKQYAEARTLYQNSLAIRIAMRDARGQAICLNHLGDASRALGNLSEAVTQYQASLSVAQDIGDHVSMTKSLTRLGHVYGEQTIIHEAWHNFQQALKQAQTMPLKLSALIGLASLLAESDPIRAKLLAIKIEQHNSAAQETKKYAAALRREISLPITDDPELVLEDFMEMFLQEAPPATAE